MSIFKDKIVLITGNGSFANAMIKRLLQEEVKEIRVYSRNEEKQVLSERTFNNPKIKFILGDIRDIDKLSDSLENVDYCIHSAALKHVKKCEENPIEAIEINIFGTYNVILACINSNVDKLVVLSTDKAANACTTYGATKYVGERIISGIDNKNTIITTTRYGNVAGSSGSVIQYFKQLKAQDKPLTITNPIMTRFYIPIEKAVDSVLYALEKGKHKDMIIYKSKSATVQMIADCISNNQIIVGAVKSEKTDEALLTERELNLSEETDDFYIVNENNIAKSTYNKPLTSDNAPRYSIEELKELIERC